MHTYLFMRPNNIYKLIMYNGSHGWGPLGGLCCGQELSGMDQEWSGKLFLKNSCILLGIPDHLNVRLRTSIRDHPCKKGNPQKTQNTQN